MFQMFLSVLFCLFQLRVTLVRNEYTFFENITAKKADVILMRYEKCLIELKIQDSSYPIYNQPPCMDDGDLYPPNFLPWQTSKSLKIKGILSGCFMGYGHPTQGALSGRNFSRDLDTDGTCATRSISERKGLRSQWLVRGNDLSTNYPYLLRQTLQKFGIHHVSMLGDSMTLQVSKFFACDLSRSPLVEVRSQSYILDHSSKLQQYGSFDINSYELHLAVWKVKVPCTYDLARGSSCTTSNITDLRKAVYSGMTSTFQYALSSSTQTSSPNPGVLIFNAGLHVFESNRDWMVPALVRALLNTAKGSLGKYFVFFRETSAQHFNARIGGCYDGTVSHSYRPGAGGVGWDVRPRRARSLTLTDSFSLTVTPPLLRIYNRPC